MTTEEFRELVLSFPGAVENPHFDRVAFKVIDKRIFATMHEGTKSVNLKFSTIDQSVFCSFGKGFVFTVPNKWGLQGWTIFDLEKVPKELMLDALDIAYKELFKTSKRTS